MQPIVLLFLGILSMMSVQEVHALPPDIVKEEFHFSASKRRPLYLRLDIDVGELDIRPSGEPREIYLVARYERRRYELDVEFDEDDNELKVYFDIHKWFKKEDRGESVARLELELPENVPIEIESRVKAGVTNIELGGIRLRAAELKLLAGETVISFSEPNRDILEEFYIDVKIGELSLEKLGNANFRYAAIDGSIGELSVDFTGELEPEFDREVDLNLSIGETVIYLYEDEPVRFSVSKFLFLTAVDVPPEFRRRGRYYFSRTYEEAKHRMEISISPGLGSLDVRVRKSSR